MGSSLSSGYYSEQARKAADEPCKKSPTGKHESKVVDGRWPSVRLACAHCGKHLGYSK